MMPMSAIFTNTFPIHFETKDLILKIEINQRSIALRGNEKRISITQLVKNLREFFIQNRLNGFAAALKNKAVILVSSRNEEILTEYLEETYDISLSNIKINKLNLNSVINIGLARIIAKSILAYILRILYDNHWMIYKKLTEYKVVPSDPHKVKLPEKLAEIAEIYYGCKIDIISFKPILTILNEVKESHFKGIPYSWGITIDHTLITDPKITLDYLLSRNIRYNESEIIRRKEVLDLMSGCRCIITESWKIKRITNDVIECWRLEANRELREEQFPLREAYPVPRPEVLDNIARKLYNQELPKFTAIVKLHSFHVTIKRKKDLYAAKKRWNVINSIFQELFHVIKNTKKLWLDSVKIEILPQPVYVEYSWVM